MLQDYSHFVFTISSPTLCYARLGASAEITLRQLEQDTDPPSLKELSSIPSPHPNLVGWEYGTMGLTEKPREQGIAGQREGETCFDGAQGILEGVTYAGHRIGQHMPKVGGVILEWRESESAVFLGPDHGGP